MFCRAFARFAIVPLALTCSTAAPAQQGAAIDYAAPREETVRAMREYLAINTTNPRPGSSSSA